MHPSKPDFQEIIITQNIDSTEKTIVTPTERKIENIYQIETSTPNNSSQKSYSVCF